MRSSGDLSTVIRRTVSPQTPLGSIRLFIHMAYVQLATLHISSVHRHQTESRRLKLELLAHLKDEQLGEHALT